MKLAASAQSEGVKLLLIGGAALFALWYVKRGLTDAVSGAVSGITDAAGAAWGNATEILGQGYNTATATIPGGDSLPGAQSQSTQQRIVNGLAATNPFTQVANMVWNAVGGVAGAKPRDTSTLQAYFQTYGYTQSTLTNARASGWSEGEITTAANAVGFY